MSFLENPFADEEEPADEPILSGNPFGDYDATLRENEYNAVFVQNEKMERQLRDQEEKNALMMAEHIRQTTALRTQLQALLEQRAACTTQPSATTAQAARDCEAAATMNNERQLLLDSLARQTADTKANMATMERAVNVFRSRLTTHSTTAVADSRALSVKSMPPLFHVLEGSKDEKDILAARDGALEPLQRCVARLIEIMSAPEAANVAETALVNTLLGYAKAALQRHQRITRQAAVAARRAARDNGDLQRVVEDADKVAHFLRRAPPLATPVTTPPRGERRTNIRDETMELRDGEAANAVLAGEIKRVEAAIVAAVKEAGAKGVADLVPVQYACAAQLLQAEDRLRALRVTTEQLGNEVLSLRQVLSLPPSSSTGLAPSLAGTVTGGSSLAHTASNHPLPLDRELILRNKEIAQLLLECSTGDSEPVVPPASDEVVTPTRAELEISVATAEKFLSLQDACLKGLASINEQLQKQAYSANLLVQAVLHSSDLDDAFMQRILDVPPPTLPPALEPAGEASDHCTAEAVGLWYLDSSAAAFNSTCEELSAHLTDVCSKAEATWGKRRRDWESARGVLCRFLGLPAATTRLADRQRSGTDASEARQLTTTEAHLQASVESEVADTAASVDGLIKNLTQAIETRRTELENKLMWLSRQPHADPLKTLRDMDREIKAQRAKLLVHQQTVQNAEVATARLAAVAEEVRASKATVALLEEKVLVTQKEFEELGQKLQSLP